MVIFNQGLTNALTILDAYLDKYNNYPSANIFAVNFYSLRAPHLRNTALKVN